MILMAEFNEDGIFQRVMSVNDIDMLDAEGNVSETVGSAFCNALFGGIWKQVSDEELAALKIK